jgi:hypothetical protein
VKTCVLFYYKGFLQPDVAWKQDGLALLNKVFVSKFAFKCNVYRYVTHHYWYEFFMDDLPIWGFVGEYVDGERSETEAGAKPESQVFIYTHKSFEVGGCTS